MKTIIYTARAESISARVALEIIDSKTIRGILQCTIF